MNLVIDSCTVGDVLEQYFCKTQANYGHGFFEKSDTLGTWLVQTLNRVLREWHANGRNRNIPDHIVVISAFAFVELARKWDKIVGNRFTKSQVRTFLQDPPTWVNLAPVDSDLTPFFLNVPRQVEARGEKKPVEWCDAVHVATVLSRGTNSTLITTDDRLLSLTCIAARSPT